MTWHQINEVSGDERVMVMTQGHHSYQEPCERLNVGFYLWNCVMTLCIESDRVVMLKSWRANLVPMSMTPSTETGLKHGFPLQLVASSVFSRHNQIIALRVHWQLCFQVSVPGQAEKPVMVEWETHLASRQQTHNARWMQCSAQSHWAATASMKIQFIATLHTLCAHYVLYSIAKHPVSLLFWNVGALMCRSHLRCQ
jgi:hypothetical protein